MTFSYRPLAPDDADASRTLGWEAFGMPDEKPTEPATLPPKRGNYFGGFDGETLAARMLDRPYDSYFGGASIATSGIAGVTVAAEYRGRGLLTPLFAETLSSAAQRGAIISTLFPTAPKIYRKFGYEVIGAFVTAQVPTAVLAAIRPPAGIRTRRATEADYDAIRSVYDAWALAQNGPLSRRGVSFDAPGAEVLADFSGASVAVDSDDQVCGYAFWNRGQGYHDKAKIEVSDLHATGPDGYRALLALIGSFASVCPNTTFETSGNDIIRTILGAKDWHITHEEPYMLKILDVAAAVGARTYSSLISTELSFRVAGDALDSATHGYVLRVTDGKAECWAADTSLPEPVEGAVFSPQGLSLAYAGSQSCANLRAAGHLWGGSATDDASWDVLFGGRQVHIRDYF